MFTSLRSRSSVVVGLGVAVAVAVVGGAVAYASIPDSSGVVHGCYSHAMGSLRVIDTASTDPINGKCLTTETAISWNQQGAPGVPGAKGDAGPQGETGPAGPPGTAINMVAASKDDLVDISFGAMATVVSLHVPKGSWLILATPKIQNEDAERQQAFCTFSSGGRMTKADVPGEQFNLPTEQALTVQAATTLGADTTVDLKCGGGANMFAGDVTMTATPVAGITQG